VMVIGSGLGLLSGGWWEHHFEERVGTYVVEVGDVRAFQDAVRGDSDQRIGFGLVGTVTAEPILRVGVTVTPGFELSVDELTRAWRATLDW
jgi:hypothetical protein